MDGHGITEDEGRGKATEMEREEGKRQSKPRASCSRDSGPPGQREGGEDLVRGGAEREPSASDWGRRVKPEKKPDLKKAWPLGSRR